MLLYNLFRNGMEACMEIPPDRERRLELVLMERKDETDLKSGKKTESITDLEWTVSAA